MGARQSPELTAHLIKIALKHRELQFSNEPRYGTDKTSGEWGLKWSSGSREPQYFEYVMPRAAFYSHPSPLDFQAQGWLVCVLTCPPDNLRCSALCPRGKDKHGKPCAPGCQGPLTSVGWESKVILGMGQPCLLVFQMRKCNNSSCKGKWPHSSCSAACAAAMQLSLRRRCVLQWERCPHFSPVCLKPHLLPSERQFRS